MNKDITGLQFFEGFLDGCKRHKTRSVICEAKPNVLKKLKLAELIRPVGADNMIDQIRQLGTENNAPTGL